MKTLCTLALGLLSLLPPQASAVVMTFGTLEISGTGISMLNSHSEAGFNITSPDPVNPQNGYSFFSWQQGNSKYAASAGLGVISFLSHAVLVPSGGGTFSLQSMDLAPAKDFTSEFGISFVGQTIDGSVTASATVSGSGFSTFRFPSSFTNLTSVSWQQGPRNFTHQFDNIVVTPTGTVPDCGTTLTLLGLALTTLAGVRRKFGV